MDTKVVYFLRFTHGSLLYNNQKFVSMKLSLSKKPHSTSIRKPEIYLKTAKKLQAKKNKKSSTRDEVVEHPEANAKLSDFESGARKSLYQPVSPSCFLRSQQRPISRMKILALLVTVAFAYSPCDFEGKRLTETFLIKLCFSIQNEIRGQV